MPESITTSSSPRISSRNYGSDPGPAIRITLIGLITNLLLMLFKFWAGIIGNSQAMLADASHTLSDLSTDFAVIFGAIYWTRPADASHPYGHRRIETIITVFIAIVLTAVAIGIGYSAIPALLHPHQTSKPGMVALFAALLSIVTKEILYQGTIYEGRRIRSTAIIANAWHHRSDALSSLPVALSVLITLIYPQLAFVDHIGALIVAGFILYAAIGISKQALSELCDEAAPDTLVEMINTIARSHPQVRSIHAIRTRRMGDQYLVDFHILVDPTMTVMEGHEVSEHVKQDIFDRVTAVTDVIIHLEPFTADEIHSTDQ